MISDIRFTPECLSTSFEKPLIISGPGAPFPEMKTEILGAPLMNEKETGLEEQTVTENEQDMKSKITVYRLYLYFQLIRTPRITFYSFPFIH